MMNIAKKNANIPIRYTMNVSLFSIFIFFKFLNCF